MTESEWAASADPQAMLAFLRESGRTSDRKLRLFAVACCRRVAHMLATEAREGLDLAERVAEGSVDSAERKRGWEGAARGLADG